MAKFGEKAFSFTEIQKFYRIPISTSGDQCFLNVGKSSVVKIHNQKTVHTWTLTHPNYFSSPVVYFDETLYCVMNNNVLIQWSVNEDNLKNAEKNKFQDSVFAVIPVIGEQPLVLFSSGKCAVIDGSDISNLKPIVLECLKANEELIWADTSAVALDIKVFCFAYNEKNKSYTIYSFIVNKNEKTASGLHSHIVSHQTTDLRNWCLNSYDSSFMSVWSDGIVCHHKDSVDTDILCLKDTESNTAVAITCINSTHIAVAMAGTNHKECILEIWDSKFCILKTRKVLKAPVIDNIQICADNSSIFLYLNKEVISIPFHVEYSALTAVIGKSISEAGKTSVISWLDDSGQLLHIPSSNEPEAMDVSESKEDHSVEIIAQRLLDQNSKHLMYIPESELTELLQLAVKHYKEENASEKCSVNAACVILNVVFSASFNDIFLVKYLKRMNLEETLVTLELLLSFLNHTVKIVDNVQKPSDLQILNWTCLIIQSHMEALLFSKDKKSQKLLRKLEKALCLKMDEYDDYEDIQNYFLILQKKNLLPEKSSVGKYSIETLDV